VPPVTLIDTLANVLRSRPPARIDEPGRARAAVAIVLVPGPDSILLIRRAIKEGDRWSGQMAFPGGRWSAADPDLLATARRETFEEVGVDLTAARVIGALDDIAPRSQLLPPITVSPFVFALASPVPLVPNHEVAAASWVPLTRFVERDTFRPFEFDTQGTKLLFPGYHLEEGVVWGLTERILTPFLGLIGMPPGAEESRPTAGSSS
jgi:8-oxo-dGTP pyrophosphatase MutT (NUDIX family)